MQPDAADLQWTTKWGRMTCLWKLLDVFYGYSVTVIKHVDARTFLCHLTYQNPDHLPSHSWTWSFFSLQWMHKFLWELIPRYHKCIHPVYIGALAAVGRGWGWTSGWKTVRMREVLVRQQQISCWFQESGLQKNSHKKRNIMGMFLYFWLIFYAGDFGHWLHPVLYCNTGLTSQLPSNKDLSGAPPSH